MRRSIDSKPIRTSNNKPPQSGVIRKGSMTQSQAEAMAKELHQVIEEVEAPEIEPIGSYEVYAGLIKANCSIHGTYEASNKELSKVFPQVNIPSKAVTNLHRNYGISYRRTDDSYIFYIEPTKEELILQLTSAESKVIELKKQLQSSTNYHESEHSLWLSRMATLEEENTHIESELYHAKTKVVMLFILAIILFISIIYFKYETTAHTSGDAGGITGYNSGIGYQTNQEMIKD